MMSVLFVGLVSHLRGGVVVWQRVTEAADGLQRQRVAFGRLERELANAVVFDPSPNAYGDDVGQLPPAMFGGGALRWYTASAAPAGGRAASIRLVTYSCQAVGGQEGLWRISQSIGEARTAHDPEPEASNLLLSGCRGWTIRYAYARATPSGQGASAGGPLEWRDQWESTQPGELPRLLRVSIELASEGRQGTRGITAEHVLTIPTGVLKTLP